MTKHISWTTRVESYIAYRRNLGFELKTHTPMLLQFARFAGKGKTKSIDSGFGYAVDAYI